MAYFPVRPQLLRGLSSRFSPTALYHFDSSLNDSSGNSLHLSALAGTVQYGIFGLRKIGLILDGATAVRRTTRSSALDGVADMTVQALVLPWVTGPTSRVFLHCYGGGGNAGGADNVLHSLAWIKNQVHAVTGVNAGCLSALWESGSAVAQAQNSTTNILTGQVRHVAQVRTGTSLQTYVDGVLQDTITGVTLPTVSSPAQYLTVGGNDAATVSGDFFTGVLHGLKITIGTAYTPAQIFSEYAYCFGN